MPRIQEYRQQTRTPGAVDFQRAPSSSGIGQGLQEIGRATNNIIEDVNKYVAKEAEYNANAKFSEANLADKEFAKTELDAYDPASYFDKTKNPEGKTFESSFSEKLQQRREALLETATNGYERRILEAKLTDFHSRLTSQATEIQDSKNKTYGASLVKDNLTKHANAVRSNGILLEDSVKTMDDYVGSVYYLDEATKNDLKKQANTVLHDSALDGYVTKLSTTNNITTGEIDKAINELKDTKGKWVNNSSKEKFDQSLSQLQKLKEVTTERNKSDFQFGFKQEMDRMKTTGEDRGKYTEAEIRNAGFNAKETEKMVREQSYARTEAKEYSQIKDMSFEEASKLVTPEAIEKLLLSDPENFYLVQGQAQARLNAWNKRTQLMKNDPVNYVEKVSSVVQAKRDAMEVALRNDPSGLKNETITSVEDYASSLVSEQKRLNPYSDPTILDASTIASIKYQIDSVPKDANGVDKAMLVLEGQLKQWGKYAPVAFKDLKANKAISSSHYVAATLLTDPSKAPLARDIIKSAVMPAIKVDEQKMKDLREEAKTQLEDLKTSLSTQADGDKIYADYEETLAKLKYYYEDNNLPSPDMDDLAKTVILDNYDFDSGYRVPKQNGVSILDNVNAGASFYLNNISNVKNLSIPKSYTGIKPEDARDIYINRILDKGRWVNNGDKGLQLIDGEGNNVFIEENGQVNPIRLDWDELNLLNNEAKSKAAERKSKATMGSKI